MFAAEEPSCTAADLLAAASVRGRSVAMPPRQSVSIRDCSRVHERTRTSRQTRTTKPCSCEPRIAVDNRAKCIVDHAKAAVSSTSDALRVSATELTAQLGCRVGAVELSWQFSWRNRRGARATVACVTGVFFGAAAGCAVVTARGNSCAGRRPAPRFDGPLLRAVFRTLMVLAPPARQRISCVHFVLMSAERRVWAHG